MEIKDFVTDLSKEFLSKSKFEERSDSEEEAFDHSLYGTGISWKNPSAQTVTLIDNLFINLFTADNRIDLDHIESVLMQCPPDEDILQIEDRDHYNLIEKAVIIGNIAFLNLLLNHGCCMEGRNEEVACRFAKKCPHNNLGTLHMCAYLGRTDMVNLLLRRGANKLLKKRVYFSGVINCPGSVQKQCNDISDNTAEIFFRCGCREPIFYAVCGDQLETMTALLQDQMQSGNSTNDYKHLLHLACRIGAYNCLKYLLNLFPGEVNTKDSDGLSPLLMAMNHGMSFVVLLLNHGADIHSVDGLLGPGSNILHLLYNGLPNVNIDDLGMCHVTKMVIKLGASVNASRQPTKYTPLHDLLASVNCLLDFEEVHFTKCKKQNSFLHQQLAYDDDILQCVQVLLEHGADVKAIDKNRQTPLVVLLSNNNFVCRFDKATDFLVKKPISEAAKAQCFGLDNVRTIAKMVYKVSQSPQEGSSLCKVITMMNTHKSNFKILKDPRALEQLENPELLSGFCNLIEVCAQNENTCKFTAILYLLANIFYTGDSTGYTVPIPTAVAMSQVLRILLKYEKFTDCENAYSYHHGMTKFTCFGCFDYIIKFLRLMKDFPDVHTASDLEALHTISLPFFQFGVKPILYNNFLYENYPSSNEDPEFSYCHLSHSFLHQYLLFGISNLKFVEEGSYYRQYLTIICGMTEHYTYFYALREANLNFQKSHDVDCRCGQCSTMKDILKELVAMPKSLKSLCREVLYDCIGHKMVSYVDHLPLPTIIKSYLLYVDM